MMADLFDENFDREINIGISDESAKHSDVWRQKLKAGHDDVTALDNDDEDSCSSEEEDEDAKELTEQVERDFFKTLSYLKKKDPSIYDKEVRFFRESDSTNISGDSKTKKNEIEKPLFVRDYQRKLIVERSGKVSDDEDDRRGYAALRPSSPTLVQEQQAIKDSFKAVLQDSDDEGNTLGGLFESRKKTSNDLKKESDGYYEWLKGQHDDMKDENVKSDLKHLHDYWNDPKLDCNEAFLRNYMLDKKFLESEDKVRVPTFEEIVHDSDEGLSGDEATVAKQEEFEHKFNFRFEEPDQDFIKRFPRTIENSLRRKDTRRKENRKKVKERKVAEKDRKKEKWKQLNALKRKEIMDRIENLKQITGNANVGFKDDDIEGDFNPAEYDKRMSQLFTDEFYREDEDNDEKPEFPELSEELKLENWNDCEGQGVNPGTSGDYEPHCDDPNFNMDCDFDPFAKFQSTKKKKKELKEQKKKGRNTTFAQALDEQKPIFNPNDRTFDKYIDEYYGMDFEDLIGDLPCRFKYRSVEPNDFGLTVEEILSASDKELNKWCSQQKAIQIRPEYDDRKLLKQYKKKAMNTELKKKIFISLYGDETEEFQQPKEVENKKKKKKKKGKLKTEGDLLKKKTSVAVTSGQDEPSIVEGNKEILKEKKKKKPNKTKKDVLVSENTPGCETEHATSSEPFGTQKTTSHNGEVPKKRKNNGLIDESSTGQLHKKRKVVDCAATLDGATSEILQVKVSKKETKKAKKDSNVKESSQNVSRPMSNSGIKEIKNAGEITRRMKKKEKNVGARLEEPQLKREKINIKPVNQRQVMKSKEKLELAPFSDSRLKAYGLQPRKFKNYLKYGKNREIEKLDVCF